MPTDAEITEFIRRARAEGIGEKAIDAEVVSLLSGASAPSPIPTRILRGGEEVPLRSTGVGPQVAPSIIGSLAGGFAGPGGALGGFLVGRGVEGLIARRRGEPEPTLPEIAQETALMLAAPPALGGLGRVALKGGKFVGRTGNKLAANLLARLAGVGTQELETAVSTPAVTQGTAPKAFDVVGELRSALGRIREEGIAEFQQARGLLSQARPVRLAPALKILSRGLPEPVGPTETAAARELAETLKDIVRTTRSQSLEEAVEKRVPAALAERLKQSLQRMSDFSGRPSDDPIQPVLKSAAASLRMNIQASLPSSSLRSQYGRLMRIVSEKLDVTKKLTQKVGEFKESAENFVRLLQRGGKTEQRQLVERFDRLFGTDFVDKARVASSVESFGGTAPLFTSPRFTATGGLLGTGLGATVGAAVGGTPGAGVGALAGLAAGSPRGAIAVGRGVRSMTDALRIAVRQGGRSLSEVEPLFPGISGALAPSLRTAIEAVLQNDNLPPEEKERVIQRLVSRQRQSEIIRSDGDRIRRVPSGP